MLGAVYTHYALHDKLDRMAPGIVFSLLLITRLIIYQMQRRIKRQQGHRSAEPRRINANQYPRNQGRMSRYDRYD